MKRTAAIFLQVVTVLAGVGVLAWMLWEPHLEGRNADATFLQVYFNDPFLAYAYAASIAFFTALYQAFKLLGYFARERMPSLAGVKALRAIKYCAIALIGFIAAPLAYLLIVRPGDDIAGGVAVSLFLIVASAAAAATAAALEKRVLRAALNAKSGQR